MTYLKNTFHNVISGFLWGLGITGIVLAFTSWWSYHKGIGTYLDQDRGLNYFETKGRELLCKIPNN